MNYAICSLSFAAVALAATSCSQISRIADLESKVMILTVDMRVRQEIDAADARIAERKRLVAVGERRQ